MAWVEKRGPRSWRVRYWKDDGVLASMSGFTTKSAASKYAEDLESDFRKGMWIDPAAGRLSLEDWTHDWLAALDVNPNTEAQYRSMLANHILPQWGSTALADISGIKVLAWCKSLRKRGYRDSTIGHIHKILSLLLADAVDDRIIPTNPLQGRRRRRHHPRPVERSWITPDQALLLADRAAERAGPSAAILITTAAWTGARWGELVGLQRDHTHLDAATITIDPQCGALREVNGQFTLGPPKTPESARSITLPNFLIALLRAHLDTHNHQHVFLTSDQSFLRRSNFARRVMRPAVNATQSEPDAVPLDFTFHGLRHSHKTWLIGDGIPEIAQARRLGHTLGNHVAAIYSHLPTETEHAVLDALEDRWRKAVAHRPTPVGTTQWRHHLRPGNDVQTPR